MRNLRSNLLNRFRHYLKGPNPLHPSVWEGRLSPIIFRKLETADISQCLEIYKLNEPGRFPGGIFNEYEKFLREQRSYVLIAERDGKILATGGIHYYQKPYWAELCFGLVRPSEQGTGIGTASLLARLALLKESAMVYHVLIGAVTKSLGFYERFGFRRIGSWQDTQGAEHPLGSLAITYAEAQACRELLTQHGITVPEDKNQVPFRETKEEKLPA
jgi:N-acetylglutamate synthase-like GNAT family acetyltransferase